MASDKRRTIMLEAEAHGRINALAAEFDASQPEVIQALLDAADPGRIRDTLDAMRRERQLSRQERLRKRHLLELAAETMSAGELERLLAQLDARRAEVA